MNMLVRLVSVAMMLSTVILFTGPPASRAEAPAAEQAVSKMKGKIKTVVNKNKTISMQVEGKGLVVVKYTDDTKVVNAGSFKEFHADDVISVEYKPHGAENVATILAKVVAELPKGVGLMTLEEAKTLVGKGPVAGRYVMYDSRPVTRYDEGHVPTSMSLPYAAMEKADQEGKIPELLPKEKDILLVFYCAGVT